MPRRRRAVLPLAALAVALATPAVSAAQDPNSIDVPTAGGYTVHVAFSEAAGGLNPDVAAAYVGYLDSLPHGPELGRLAIQVASVDQVAGLCGSLESRGTLACYQGRQRRMTVPNVSLDATAGGYSLRYVLAHEYGHHIARSRSNPGFRGGALDWGPKFWSSYAQVCAKTAKRQLFPGNEQAQYRANPGENWAEAYARLAFPDQPWNFSPLLVPDAVALDAARRDVVEPWTGNATAVFTMPRGRKTQRFDLPVNLDGTIGALVRGPRGSQVGVRIAVDGRKLGTSRRSGRVDSLEKRVCRSAPTATVSFTAIRKGGRPGPVQLAVSYPG